MFSVSSNRIMFVVLVILIINVIFFVPILLFPRLSVEWGGLVGDGIFYLMLFAVFFKIFGIKKYTQKYISSKNMVILVLVIFGMFLFVRLMLFRNNINNSVNNFYSLINRVKYTETKLNNSVPLQNSDFYQIDDQSGELLSQILKEFSYIKAKYQTESVELNKKGIILNQKLSSILLPQSLVDLNKLKESKILLLEYKKYLKMVNNLRKTEQKNMDEKIISIGKNNKSFMDGYNSSKNKTILLINQKYAFKLQEINLMYSVIDLCEQHINKISIKNGKLSFSQFQLKDNYDNLFYKLKNVRLQMENVSELINKKKAHVLEVIEKIKT